MRPANDNLDPYRFMPPKPRWDWLWVLLAFSVPVMLAISLVHTPLPGEGGPKIGFIPNWRVCLSLPSPGRMSSPVRVARFLPGNHPNP